MIIAVNLSNWKEEDWKNKGFNGIRTRDCLMLYQLSYGATHWERGQFIEFISPVRSEMMWSIHEIIHIFELRLWIKVKNDHHSKFSNLSNWKEEDWKNQGFNGIWTRDLRDTGAMLYQLSYGATHWERGQFIEFTSPMGSEMMWSTYEIIHIHVHVFELRLWIKVKNDHRSKFSNLSNWKEEDWKNQGFNGIRTRDLRNTGRCSTNWAMEPHIGKFTAMIILHFDQSEEWSSQ